MTLLPSLSQPHHSLSSLPAVLRRSSTVCFLRVWNLLTLQGPDKVLLFLPGCSPVRSPTQLAHLSLPKYGTNVIVLGLPVSQNIISSSQLICKQTLSAITESKGPKDNPQWVFLFCLLIYHITSLSYLVSHHSGFLLPTLINQNVTSVVRECVFVFHYLFSLQSIEQIHDTWRKINKYCVS